MSASSWGESVDLQAIDFLLLITVVAVFELRFSCFEIPLFFPLFLCFKRLNCRIDVLAVCRPT